MQHKNQSYSELFPSFKGTVYVIFSDLLKRALNLLIQNFKHFAKILETHRVIDEKPFKTGTKENVN